MSSFKVLKGEEGKKWGRKKKRAGDEKAAI
jgi:hypothetical protein